MVLYVVRKLKDRLSYSIYYRFHKLDVLDVVGENIYNTLHILIVDTVSGDHLVFTILWSIERNQLPFGMSGY